MRNGSSNHLCLVAILLFAVNFGFAQSSAKANYQSKCQMCHGATGAGETPNGKMLKVKLFNDPTITSLSDSALLGVIKAGTGRMPAFTNVYTDDQINDLVQFLHQLQTQLPSK
jgi:cytochrome c6